MVGESQIVENTRFAASGLDACRQELMMPRFLFPRTAGIGTMADHFRTGLGNYAADLERRSAAIPRLLNRQIGAIAVAWLVVFALACSPRVLLPATPVHGLRDFLPIGLTYLAIALAPVAGYVLASSSFPRGTKTAPLQLRLSLYGRWQRLNFVEARANPDFGPAGFMASMLVGLMLNVVMRSFEYLLAMPAINGHGPDWAQALSLVMTLDVVIMSFFYMVCFVMALRAVPWFPRMLVFTWLLDIAMQMMIARHIGTMAGLPHAVAQPLGNLLEGNITKVLISIFVWVPYLVLSDRVNVTYRHRIRA